MINRLEVARDLAERGFSVIPIIKDDKKCPISWKKYQNEKATDDELIQWFQNQSHDIGIVTGAISQLTVIDLDQHGDDDGIATSKEKKLQLPMTSTRKTPHGMHVFTKYNPSTAQTQGKLPGIDVRNDGGYIVFFRQSGGYEWIDDGQMQRYDNRLFHSEVRNQRESVPEATRMIPKGKRHQEIIKVVAKLKKGGFSEDEAIRQTQNWNRTECNPPESEYEIVTQVRDIYLRGSFQAPEEWHVQDLSEATAEAVDWLFHPFILKNHLNVLAGKQGDGKTTFALKLLLDLVNKNRLPYGVTANEDINVMFLSKEDTSARLKERAEQMGYKLPSGRVFFLDIHTDLTDPIDQEKLIQNLKKHKINFLVLDPLTSYIGDGSPDDSKIVRPYLEFMNKSIAVGVDVTVLGLAHFNKDTQQNTLYRLRGSGAWSEVPRQVLYLAQDEEKQTGLSYIWIQKSNYVDNYDKSAKIRMKMSNSGRVEIDSEIPDELDVNELIKTNQKPKKKQDQAKDFILDTLATSGAVTWLDVQRKSPQTMTEATLRRAREDLSNEGLIQKTKSGMIDWIWDLTERANEQIYPVGKNEHLLNQDAEQIEIDTNRIEEEFKL